MKIDIFCHIVPPKFYAALEKKLPHGIFQELPYKYLPGLIDLETRFRVMDNFKDMVQVLTVSSPPLESITEPSITLELSKIANDELAELVAKYPDRFVGAVASLPMNNIDMALNELNRAVNELNLKGVQINTCIMGKPLNSIEFISLYEKMAQYKLPVWIHPFFPHSDESDQDDSQSGDLSYMEQCERAKAADEGLQMTYQTPAAMASLIYGHVFDKYPDIIFITHHCGSIVPYYADRIEMGFNIFKNRNKYADKFAKPILDYYRNFYADTALHGNVPALMCGYNFFGVDHILFGTDMPFDGELGLWTVKRTIESIEDMDISKGERKKIFEDNAKKLLQLS